MDGIGKMKSKLLFLLGIFILALAFSAAMPGANAGTRFAEPEKAEKLGPGESYAESRFGSPPPRVQTGVDSKYAARMAEEMESDGETAVQPPSPLGASRSPAGLEFASGGSASASDRPRLARNVIPERAFSDTTSSSVTPRSATARAGVQEVALIASDLGYFPKTVFVSRDVPVRLFVTGSSKNTLCIMMDSFSVRKQVRSQKIEEITFTPNIPGKYRFYCPVNGMEGVMVVKELASAVPDDSVGTQAAAPARRGLASEKTPEAAAE